MAIIIRWTLFPLSIMRIELREKAPIAHELHNGLMYRIRKARTHDWPDILHLQSLHNRPIRRDSKVAEYFVAVSSEAIVGTSAVRSNGDTGYLYGLVVAKEWRKRGIGHALTNACLDYLERAQVKRVLALAMFWNLSFFRKHGFSLIKRNSVSGEPSIHGDFSEEWSRHSALICVQLSANRLRVDQK